MTTYNDYHEHSNATDTLDAVAVSGSGLDEDSIITGVYSGSGLFYTFTGLDRELDYAIRVRAGAEPDPSDEIIAYFLKPGSATDTGSGSGSGIIKRMRKQRAVLWMLTGHNRFGDQSFAEPVEIPCRWDDVASMYLLPSGEQAVSAAIVYPDRAIVLGSRLQRGKLVDVEFPLDAKKNAGTFEVKQAAETPNLKNTQTLFTVYLG